MNEQRDALMLLPEHKRNTFELCLGEIRKLDRVKRIILFGSYAKGTASKNSDIDLAVFFDKQKECFIEEYRNLVRICRVADIDIQVQAFAASELDEPCGIIEEIVTYGVELAL